MTLEQERGLLEEIYAKHSIRVERWFDGVKNHAVSTVPRSYHDFLDDLDQANAEFREAMRAGTSRIGFPCPN